MNFHFKNLLLLFCVWLWSAIVINISDCLKQSNLHAVFWCTIFRSGKPTYIEPTYIPVSTLRSVWFAQVPHSAHHKPLVSLCCCCYCSWRCHGNWRERERESNKDDSEVLERKRETRQRFDGIDEFNKASVEWGRWRNKYTKNLFISSW